MLSISAPQLLMVWIDPLKRSGHPYFGIQGIQVPNTPKSLCTLLAVVCIIHHRASFASCTLRAMQY